MKTLLGPLLACLALAQCDGSSPRTASSGRGADAAASQAAPAPAARPGPPAIPPGTDTLHPDATAPAPAPVAASLSVTVVASEGAEPATAALTCGPGTASATGFIADAAAACRAVAEKREVLQPPPADRMCTQIYGGPQEARVVGTVDGAAIDRTIRRTNGCEIADWSALEPLLGPPPAAPAG